RNSSFGLSLVISATVTPRWKRAPVGHTSTHLPHDVHVMESPHGTAISVMTRDARPRPETSQVCTPSSSSQIRTQRVHNTQRFSSRTNNGWEASTWRLVCHG